MSHELETIDGQTAYVDSRNDAWHQLGTQLNRTFSAEEAMKHGLLGGWNVRKWPAMAVNPETGETIAIPGMNNVVRDNPVRKGQIDVLGSYPVSDGFTIVQNEDHAAFLNALVDESGAHFETAGSLYGGRQVFLTMKLPGHINVGGVDPIENYIAAVNAHDGSLAFTGMVTPVRVVCKNTLNLAFRESTNVFKVRHTSGADKNMVVRARELLDLTFNYLDDFQAEAEKLIQTTMTQSQFEAIIEREFGAPEGASSSTVTRAEKKIDEIAELFADAHTQEGIRDTAWAGFNALTEWADHFSPTRGDDRDTSRAVKSLLDPSFKQSALRLMLAQV